MGTSFNLLKFDFKVIPLSPGPRHKFAFSAHCAHRFDRISFPYQSSVLLNPYVFLMYGKGCLHSKCFVKKVQNWLDLRQFACRKNVALYLVGNPVPQYDLIINHSS